MSATRHPGALGMDLRSRGVRPCGLCGVMGELTRAHVPPEIAGNTSEVTSALALIVGGVRRTGRASKGGMWVRGLCGRCNSLAGSYYDRPYADYANVTLSYLRAARRLHLPGMRTAPPVSVAPGLVARCVLFGMFAVSPNLRTIFPQFAEDLVKRRDHIRMPDGVNLRHALYVDRTARLNGPVYASRVLAHAEFYNTLAEVYFRPFAWVLAPSGERSLRGYESRLDKQQWPIVDEWTLYGPDVTGVDLRNLAPRMPMVRHPLSEAPDQWVEMYAYEITPFLTGDVPH